MSRTHKGIVYLITHIRCTQPNLKGRTEINMTNDTLFQTIKKKYQDTRYIMSTIIFWNVNSRGSNVPVKYNLITFGLGIICRTVIH